MGKRVYVAEKSGRRVRITKPHQGWMSLETADGIEILRRDEQFGNDPNNGAILDKVFQREDIRGASFKFIAEADKFQDWEKNALNSVHKLTQAEVGQTLKGWGADRLEAEVANKVENNDVGTAVGHAMVDGKGALDHGISQVPSVRKDAIDHELSTYTGQEVELPSGVLPKVNPADVKKVVDEQGKRFYGQVAKV